MRLRISAILAAALTLLTLSGCWSGKEIQIQAYAKAIGVDHVDNEYIVYVQMLDFKSIAKMEGGSSTEEASVWVGKGHGATFNMAINDLYKTVQLPISWGHVTAILLSDNMLRMEDNKIGEMMNRYPEVRYNAWVYGTKGSIEELLSATPMFQLSPLSSILHSPEKNYGQYSMFPPVLFFQYLANVNEPAISAYLPSLTLNNEQWKENDKSHRQLMINGAFFEANNVTKGFLSTRKLDGYHLLQENMHRSPLNIERDGIMYGEISIGEPHITIKPIIQGSDVKFRIKAKYLSAMYEYLQPISNDEMTAIATEIIKGQIMGSYKEGLKIGVDIYGLEDTLYRHNPGLWKKLTNNGQHLLLDEQSIEKLDINLDILYNGKFKRRT